MTPSSGSHVYENVGPRINCRTTSSPSYSASGGQGSGRPLNPGALRDRQSQLSEPMTGSQFSGLSSALSGCKSLSERQRQRQAVVKDTPRAPIDSKGTKEALVAASRQVTSLASSSSSSSSPLAKDDNTLFTVKPRTLPQASSGSSTSSSHNGHESAESSNLKLRRQRNKSLPYNLFDSSAANYPSLRNLVTPPPNHSLPGSPRRSLRRKSQCSDFRDSSTSVCSIIYATEMVSAFENSLTAMTAKLRQAAHILDVKDKEIGGLSDLIQLLKGDCEAQAERERKRGGGETTRFKLQRKPKEKTFIVGNKEEKSPSWLRSPTKAFRSRYGSDEAAIKRKLLVSPLFSVPKTFSADAMVPFEGTGEDNETVRELRRQMGEKDKILTDMRLAALSTAHQVESTKDHISKTILEIAVLREEQLKLNCLTKVL
ncbi:hypothetical protein HDE_11739 [Halotydeus destructor]|nr:hypothetical protein HDE_11739 [Halotydeus destructor]